jgi:endonuclease YncB( thermonuclease family)
MAGAAASLAVACLLIVAGGNAVRDLESAALPPIETVSLPAAPEPSVEIERPSRRLAPAEMAPPPRDPGSLERMPARDPLSTLSLALPAKSKPLDEQEGTTLFNMVATAAGTLQGKEASVRIDGVDPVDPDETCDEGGRAWPCGVHARAAFRAMLRGRAVNCLIPPEADPAAIIARCRIGKQDIGAWLVANGWARATPGGPYGESGNKAESERKGLFGAAPATNSPTPPSARSTLPAAPEDSPG